MKKVFFIAGILLFAISLKAADFEFAKNGKANYVIALPEKLAKYDRQAADELKYYLGKYSSDFADINAKELGILEFVITH